MTDELLHLAYGPGGTWCDTTLSAPMATSPEKTTCLECLRNKIFALTRHAVALQQSGGVYYGGSSYGPRHPLDMD